MLTCYNNICRVISLTLLVDLVFTTRITLQQNIIWRYTNMNTEETRTEETQVEETQAEETQIEETPLVMIKMIFEGEPVESAFSSGLRKTTFEISLQDDMVEVRAINGSRSPSFDDVWNAFQTFLEKLQMEISDEAPANAETIKTEIGALYIGIDDNFIGRSSEGKFSFRGKRKLPVSIVQKLLYPLDDFITAEGY